MPRNPTRRQITSNAVQARRPGSGGTSAPRSAAKGPRQSLHQNKPSRAPQWRPGGKPTGPVNPGKTTYYGNPGPGPGGSAGAQVGSGTPPTPWNTKAEQIVAGARRDYLDAGANFDLAEQTAKQDFGLDPGFNDYKANPFSRAALLQESYLNAKRGTTNSAGLQLYSGSTSNALAGNRRGYDINRDELARAYRDSLGEISKARAEAALEKEEREREAEWERITAAEGAPLDSEGSFGGGGGGGGKKKKPKPKGGGGGGGKVNPPGTGWKNPPGSGKKKK